MKKQFFLILIAIIFVSCGPKPAEEEVHSSRGAMQQKVNAQKSEDFLRKGSQELSKGNVASAINNFNDAIKNNPRDSRGYLILGQTYLRLKQYDRAIDVFKAEINFDPDNGQIQYLLAMSYALNGEAALAVPHAQRSVEIFQDSQDQENFVKSLALLQGLNNSQNK